MCKNHSHILVRHMISRQWGGNRMDEVIFSSLVFYLYGVDDQWQSDMDIHLSFTNVTGKKSLCIWLQMTMNNDVDAWCVITWKTCQFNDFTMIKKWLDVIDMNKDIGLPTWIMIIWHFTMTLNDYQMTSKWWYNYYQLNMWTSIN
jgi:hypothetical protein